MSASIFLMLLSLFSVITGLVTEGIKKIAKDSLDEREYQIIVRRFGLNGNIPETQHVVAKNLGISRSYISRLESIAIQKLKTNLNK